MKYTSLMVLTLALAASISAAAPTPPAINISDNATTMLKTHKAQIAKRVSYWKDYVLNAASAKEVTSACTMILSRSDMFRTTNTDYRNAYGAEVAKQFGPLLSAKAMPKTNTPDLKWTKQINAAILFSRIAQPTTLPVQLKMLTSPKASMRLLALRGLLRQKQNLFRSTKSPFDTVTATLTTTLPKETNPLVLAACGNLLDMTKTDAKSLPASTKATVGKQCDTLMSLLVVQLRVLLDDEDLGYRPDAVTIAMTAKDVLITIRNNAVAIGGKPATKIALQRTIDLAVSTLKAYEAGMDDDPRSNLAGASAATLTQAETSLSSLTNQAKNFIAAALKTRNEDERLPNVGEAVVAKWIDALKPFGITGPTKLK